MPIAVLSPCLLEVRSKDEFRHYADLEKLIKNINECTTLRFQYYIKAPYDGFKMYAPKYDSLILNNQVTINIFGQIQKMLLPEYVDLDNYLPVVLPEGMIVQENDVTSAFRSYLNYLHGEDCVLFIGEDSFSVPRPIQLHEEGNSDEDDLFYMDASTYIDIEKTTLLMPYLVEKCDEEAAFPRAVFCKPYNAYVQKLMRQPNMDQNSKDALFEEIGEVVACYNNYAKDNRLSKINTTKNKRRIVFSKTKGRKFYLSLDFESGGFEVFDKNFVHQGQFDFSGIKVKSASPLDHVLLK